MNLFLIMVCSNCVRHFREVTVYSTSDIGYNCSLYCDYINQILLQ